MCGVLPGIISDVVEAVDDTLIPHDTVVSELRRIADKINMGSKELSMAMAIYLLGFSTYKGFGVYFYEKFKGDESYVKEHIKILYEYAKEE